MIRNLNIRPPKIVKTGLDDARPIKEVLSPVLLAVTRAIVAGKTNPEIARERGTTYKVIRLYTQRIYEATGCATRLELATRYAFENLVEMQVELMQREAL